MNLENIDHSNSIVSNDSFWQRLRQLRGLSFFSMVFAHLGLFFFKQQYHFDEKSCEIDFFIVFFGNFAMPLYLFLSGTSFIFRFKQFKNKHLLLKKLINTSLFLLLLEVVLVSVFWGGQGHYIFLQVLYAIALCQLITGIFFYIWDFKGIVVLFIFSIILMIMSSLAITSDFLPLITGTPTYNLKESFLGKYIYFEYNLWGPLCFYLLGILSCIKRINISKFIYFLLGGLLVGLIVQVLGLTKWSETLIGFFNYMPAQKQPMDLMYFSFYALFIMIYIKKEIEIKFLNLFETTSKFSLYGYILHIIIIVSFLSLLHVHMQSFSTSAEVVTQIVMTPIIAVLVEMILRGFVKLKGQFK